jgi:hypothetical protein
LTVGGYSADFAPQILQSPSKVGGYDHFVFNDHQSGPGSIIHERFS